MEQLEAASTPADIEKRSFEIIEAEIPEPRRFEGALWQVARRCIHAMGDIAILPQLCLDMNALEAGLAAMRAGCAIYTDTAMLAAGLVARRMEPLGIEVKPLMTIEGIGELAKSRGITRARAGVELVGDRLAGNIMAIGNAPTALLALLELLAKGAPAPALIIGMPVGFVNAAQSKALLAKSPWPHFTLLGRKGGSPVAAACLNAMADLLLAQDNPYSPI